MTTYTWPLDRWRPSTGTFRVDDRSVLSTSPFTSATVSGSNDDLWMTEMTFPPQSTNEAHELQAFLTRLKGAENPVWLPYWPKPFLRAADPLAGLPWSGGALFVGGSGWVDLGWSLTLRDAALKGARSVVLEGFPVSEQVLWPGDVLSFGGNMVEVDNGVTSDASGEATVTFSPRLRHGVEAATVVTYTWPAVRMRMDPGAKGIITRAQINSIEFTMRLVEAVDLAS